MKKTLVTLLALAGVAAAGEVTFTDLTKNITTSGITFTQSTGLFTGSITNYEGADAGKGSNGAITFAIDWSAASALTADTCILTLNYDNTTTTHTSGENNGIYFKADDDSIRAWFGGAVNNGGNIATTDEVSGAKKTIKGKDYAILTLRYDDIGATDATKGVSLFTSTSEIYEYWGQGSSNYDEVTSIYINTDLVKAVTIMTGEINDATAKAGVTNLAAAMVPEPTTATLSLLALAGLAARRRRR